MIQDVTKKLTFSSFKYTSVMYNNDIYKVERTRNQVLEIKMTE